MLGNIRTAIYLWLGFCCVCNGEGKPNILKVVLVGMAPLSSNLVESVSGRVSANLAMSCKVEMPNIDLDEADKALDQLKYYVAADAVVIGFVSVPGELTFRHAMDLSSRVAVLNVASLLRPDEHIAAEAVAWRVEKQATLLAAQLMGFAACPFPLCVLCEVTTIEALDAKGRNLCPPCRMRLGLETDASIPPGPGQ